MAYPKVIDDSGATSLGFPVGKSKLAPLKGHTIPRLELCGAVLATELGETICNHMNLSYEICHYYTDSQVVLGYIFNTTRRFYTYVANRVEKFTIYQNRLSGRTSQQIRTQLMPELDFQVHQI